MYDYKVENELKRLNNDLANTINELKAWEDVKRVTKKDGSDFAVYSKNFDNCKIGRESWGETNELKIFVYFKGVGYHSNAICCYDTLEKDDPRNGSPRAWARGACLKNGYLLTVDEVFKRIESHKEYLRKRIESLTDAIANYDKVIEFLEEVQKQYNSIKEQNTQLGYSIADLLRAGVIY